MDRIRLKALLSRPGERAVGRVPDLEKESDWACFDPLAVVFSCRFNTGDSALIVGKVKPFVEPPCLRGSCTDVSWNTAAIYLPAIR